MPNTETLFDEQQNSSLPIISDHPHGKLQQLEEKNDNNNSSIHISEEKKPLQIEEEFYPIIEKPNELKNGLPLLQFAIERKNTQEVKQLLRSGANPNTVNRVGKPMILLAAKLGSAEMVKEFVLKGADVNQADCEGITAIFEAIGRKDKDLVSFLLQHGANLFHQNIFEDTPFLYGLRCGFDFIQFYIEKHGAPTEEMLLQTITSKSSLLVIKSIYNTNPNFAKYKNQISGNSLLHEIVNACHYEALDWGIEIAPLHLLNYDNQTAYQLALCKFPVSIRQSELEKLHLSSYQGECSICGECTNLYMLRHCGHSFCMECLIGYAASTDFTATEIACPHHHCNSTIAYNDLKMLFEPSRFLSYDQLLLEKHLHSMKDFYWCDRCSDGGVFSVHTSPQSSVCSVAQCLSCGFRKCHLCKEVIDNDDAAQSHDVHCRGVCDYTIEKMGAKRCPKCTVLIQHSEGCSHMTCSFCKYEFCYICLGPYLGRYVFRSTGVCPCQ